MGLVLNFQISSIIHPFFLYCLPIFGATYEVHLKPLFMLQKKAIRIINGASYLQHTDPLFYSSKILKIRDQYKLSIGTYIYNNPTILHGYQRTHSHNTRYRGNLLPPRQNLRSTEQSVIYNAVLLWNSLPVGIRNSENISNFKRCLRNYLLDSYNH